MVAKRGHKWVKSGTIRVCEYCGVEKWLSGVFHFPPGHPHYSPKEKYSGASPVTKEPPCIKWSKK